MSPEARWYALYTNPRAEKKAAQELSARGFESFLPLQTTLKQWSDRKKKVQEPLFKSYLFVKTDLERHHADVLSVNGIVKFVRIGKETVPVRDEVIEAIRLSLLHYKDLETSSENFALHQQVKVIAGPLTGITGYVSGIASNQYLAIRVEQLGTSLLVKIPAAYLELTA